MVGFLKMLCNSIKNIDSLKMHCSLLGMNNTYTRALLLLIDNNLATTKK